MVQTIDVLVLGADNRLDSSASHIATATADTANSSSNQGTFRRMIDAVRYCFTKRSRSKKPDWLLDKHINRSRSKSIPSEDVPSDASTTNLLCSRLSVDPSLPSHYRWLALVSLAVLYNIIFVVGRAVFWEINRNIPALWFTLDYICDTIYLIDILVHCHEGYLDQGLLVRDAAKLRKHYFTTKGWRLDILSVLPTDFAYFWWQPRKCHIQVPCPVIVRLNRLFRLPRMLEWFERTETATGYPNAFRICKVVLAILVLIHWNACLYFAISFALGFGSDNWVYNINGPINSTLSRQYIYSFYWSTLTLTTIIETPTPENDIEYLFVVADFLAGVLIFATIVGNIGSMISNINVARVEFQNRMDGVKQYMAFRKVGHELEARVIRWFAYTWARSGALDEERVLSALPDKFKAEIAIRVHMETLKQVRIFQDCEPGLLEALVLKLKLQDSSASHIATATADTANSSSNQGTFRRMIDAVRYCFTKRSRSKKPDWLLDKHINRSRSKSIPSEDVPSDASTTNLLCSRLSVDPSLPSHYRWLALVSLAVLYNIIFVVGRAVFWEINRNIPALWFTLDYICDTIYLIDILVHCHEGYLDQGLLVRDAAKLRKHYFTTKGWRLDILSVLPTDFAYFWWQPRKCHIQVPCPVIVRLNRLFRLPRMLEWFERTETATGYPNAFRICKVVLAILVLIHWNACLYFAISFALGFGSDNWVYNINGPINSTLSRQYIYSFYWSTLTLTTIIETPTPENDIEYLFVVADFLAGVLIFATIVGNIGSMISNINVARVEFQNRMDGVKQYMAFRKVGHELEARVIRWFAYTWARSGALDEERVLSALPDKFKAEIAIRVHMETLKQVRIFQDCEPGLLEALVLKLKLQVFSPGDYICRKGDVGKEMYIVKRGRLSVVADDGVTVLATLGAGSIFGEVSVLDIPGNKTGNRRTANVRSLGYSDLFCLAKRDLWETLGDYPEARASLTERGCQLLRKDGLLDEEIFAKASTVQETLTDGVHKLEKSIENLNVRLSRLLAEYSASQAKLKQRIAKLELSAMNPSPASPTFENSELTREIRLYSIQPKQRRPRMPIIFTRKGTI